ncbi:MAG: TIGR03790 family protein [Planctomycetota bacterium]|jgi:uncharacterized protein (TIGR03790 family)
MKFSLVILIVICFVSVEVAAALEPNEILVVANWHIPESMRLAEYYCLKRKVPKDRIFALPLGNALSDTISRQDYETKLAGPIRSELIASGSVGKIKCLVMTYGVPFKVGRRGQLPGKEKELAELKRQVNEQKGEVKLLEESTSALPDQLKQAKVKLVRLESQINRITGKETSASVDSELSLVLVKDYELYRWLPNKLKGTKMGLNFAILMVSRLDGPGYEIAKGLIDKAIAAEKKPLSGVAYIDSRGFADDKVRYSFGYFDQSLRDLAGVILLRTNLSVKQETTPELFGPGSCPDAALYCGWYSLSKYIDSFTFVDGAIGYHIASLEAVDLRGANSSQWCPAMLRAGVTATFGAVGEPYLHSFPEPKAFFLELFNGRCLVEAYYRTKPFNSWQMVLIGDPLYRPFKSQW